MPRLTLDIPDALGDGGADDGGDSATDGPSDAGGERNGEPRPRGGGGTPAFVRWVACWAESGDRAD